MAFPAHPCAASLVARSFLRNGLGHHLTTALQRRTAGELWYRPAIGSESNVGDFFNLCSAFTVAKIVLEENPISYHGYCHQRSHLSALPAKPTLDAEFLRVFRQRFYYAESCHNQVVEIPEGFPFEIQDDNGKSIITLRRKYRNENIEVIVGKADYKCDCVDFCECDYWDTSCIPLTVRVKKGESSPSLEIICTSYLDDVIINAVYLKQDPSSWGMLSYEGPDFNDLDENLQKAFQRYLELRGVSHVKLSCLHENGLDKCHRKYLHSLWSVRQFLER